MSRTRTARNRRRLLVTAAVAGMMATAFHVTANTGRASAQNESEATDSENTATDQGAGTLVSVAPSAFRLPLGISTPTEAWKIHYRSTTATGKADVVSGIVIVPKDGHSGPRPLLTYVSGTVGMGDQCAPSNTLPTGGNPGAVTIAKALLRGWAVVVTDLPGLGTEGDHTYMVGRAAGTAVLDAARAAQHLPEGEQAGITDASPVGLMGYSQGGHATAWAAELADTYAPELNLKGTASGGVPADLVPEGGDSGDNAGLALMTAIGHDAAYPELGLDSYLNDEGRALTAKLRTGCVPENALATMGKSVEDVTTSNPLASPAWIKRLEDDKLGTTAPKHPMFLYHGTSDTIAPYELAKQLRDEWCAQGSTVDARPYPLADHIAAALVGADPALEWLEDRFDGSATQGNCD